MGFLKDMAPSVNTLAALDLEFSLMSNRQCLLMELLLKEYPPQALQTTYNMQASHIVPPLQVPINK